MLCYSSPGEVTHVAVSITALSGPVHLISFVTVEFFAAHFSGNTVRLGLMGVGGEAAGIRAGRGDEGGQDVELRDSDFNSGR